MQALILEITIITKQNDQKIQSLPADVQDAVAEECPEVCRCGDHHDSQKKS